jgi:hypothetical protein
MKLKKLLLMMVLLTIAGKVSSHVSFSVDPLTISPGINQKEYVDIKASISGTYIGCQFDLLLPEGLSIVLDSENHYMLELMLDKKVEDHVLTVSNLGGNLYQFMIKSPSNRSFVQSSKRILVSVKLIAADNATPGEKTAKIQNGSFFVSDTQSEKLADLAFTITVKEGSPDPTPSPTNPSATGSEGCTIVKEGDDVTLKSINGDAVAKDGGLTVPGGVTQIDENAFDGLSDAEKETVQYVDLSNTNVTGLTVDRDNGVFEGFSDNTLIMLPKGNDDGGEPNVVIGSTCRELVLDDDKDIVLPKDFTAQKVTYNRTLTSSDEAYTTCLPFSQSSNESVKFYELTSSTSDNLVFTEVTTTKANKPYLAVSAIADVSLGTQTTSEIKKNTDFDGSEKAVTGYKMLGTMKRINRDNAMGFYILQDGNEWHPIGPTSPATVSIPPYRAYIVGITDAARLHTIFSDDATTIRTINADGSEQWYDMNGRKLSGMPNGKGAYIVNSKKVIMK